MSLKPSSFGGEEKPECMSRVWEVQRSVLLQLPPAPHSCTKGMPAEVNGDLVMLMVGRMPMLIACNQMGCGGICTACFAEDGGM